MTDPITFDSTSPRLGLPLLFSGQAQKEVYLNEALSRLDGLTHCAVEAEASTPPATPTEGQAWLIGASASGEWTGKTGHLALRQGGQWLYVPPQEGMRVLNRTSGQDIRRIGGVWRAVATPAAATGGSVVDSEARAVLVSLVNALKLAGIFAT